MPRILRAEQRSGARTAQAENLNQLREPTVNLNVRVRSVGFAVATWALPRASPARGHKARSALG